MLYINIAIFAGVDLISCYSEFKIFAAPEKATTPTKSSMPSVLSIPETSSFTIENLAPSIDFETSRTMTTFLEPVVADTYHGLILGS